MLSTYSTLKIIILQKTPLPVNKESGSFILLVLVLTSFLAGLSLLGFRNTIQSSKLTTEFINNKLAFLHAQVALYQAQSRIKRGQIYEIKTDYSPVDLANYPQLLGIRLLTTRVLLDEKGLWRDNQYVVLNWQLKSTSEKELVSSYIVEKLLLGDVEGKVQYFRVTAKGFDYDGINQVTLQAIVRSRDQLERLSWLQIP